jgi:hypothetical protein
LSEQIDLEDWIEQHGGPKRPLSPRVSVLADAIKITGVDRQAQYGDVVRNMESAAILVSAWIKAKYAVDLTLDGEDISKIMTMIKDVRTMQGVPHKDNYIDGAAYEAIAYECRIAKDKRGQGG